MLLKFEQLKHLDMNFGAEDFIFVGHETATDEEKKELLKLDEANIKINGFHLIRNYEDLKK